jgi:hypothetical protein
VNVEERVARLTSLLERVKARAGGRSRLEPSAAPAPAPAVPSEPPRAMQPVVTPGSAVEAEETAPYAKLTTAQLAQAVGPTPEPRQPPPEPASVDASELDLREAVELGEADEVGPVPVSSQEPASVEIEPLLEPAEERAAARLEEPSEPPASSRRVVAEPDTQQGFEPVTGAPEEIEPPPQTPPPESGPQVVVQIPPSDKGLGALEVDFANLAGSADSLAPADRPSMEQLGQTVDLEPSSFGSEMLELAASTPDKQAPEPPSGEMEAVIPGAQAPGAYSPALEPPPDAAEALARHAEREGLAPAEPRPAPTTVQVPDSEPPMSRPVTGVSDWPDVEPVPAPVPVEIPAAAVPRDAEAARILTQGPPADTLAPRAPAGEAPPTVLVEAQVFRPVRVPAAAAAELVGAARSFQPQTFVELLDASLSLGR